MCDFFPPFFFVLFLFYFVSLSRESILLPYGGFLFDSIRFDSIFSRPRVQNIFLNKTREVKPCYMILFFISLRTCVHNKSLSPIFLTVVFLFPFFFFYV